MKLRNIATGIQQLKRELKVLETVYDEQKTELRKKIVALQEQCPHPKSTYYPDASGNNDSWSECELCGKEV